MDKNAIERLIHRWTSAIESGLDAWDDLLGEDVWDRSTDPPTQGRATFRARAEGVRRAYPGFTLVVDAIVIDGDDVAWRWTLRGKNAERVQGANFQTMRDGKVVEHWTIVRSP